MKKEFVVILFYKFVRVDDTEALRDVQKALGQYFDLKGRMLIAEEGVNATFEGTKKNIKGYIKALKSDPRFADIRIKESKGDGKSFSKLMVKVRKEIVTLDAGEFDPATQTAKTVSADELQKWYEEDEDFVVLDLRNSYEIDAGKFERTVDPGLQNFRDLSEKMPELEQLKGKKVVAVCTGGIRCEKATCLMKEEGFENLYQLEDGIHTYMQKYPGQHFKGTLFVFDNRMVTDVVDTPHREIIGRCAFCEAPSETFYNDDAYRPSKKVICCENCLETEAPHLRPVV